jgi:hypothetical protein
VSSVDHLYLCEFQWKIRFCISSVLVVIPLLEFVLTGFSSLIFVSDLGFYCLSSMVVVSRSVWSKHHFSWLQF